MIKLHFDGYWTNENCLPTYSGIYIVSAVRIISNTVVNARILYIGQADNIHKRHVEDGPHEHLKDFINELHIGEQIGYTCAPVDDRSLDKVENALVHMQQPIVNGDLKHSYKHGAEEFQITGTGESAFIHPHFGFSKENDASSFYIVDEEDDNIRRISPHNCRI